VPHEIRLPKIPMDEDRGNFCKFPHRSVCIVKFIEREEHFSDQRLEFRTVESGNFGDDFSSNSFSQHTSPDCLPRIPLEFLL
ncbi:hypothetical protein PMAYCL1PPCAC_33340, partial [Pristionchus mayeri]